MRNMKKIAVAAATLAALLLASLAFGPCVEKRTLDNGLAGFRVTIVSISGASGGDGRKNNPFDYPEGEITLTIDAAAFDKLGNPMDGESGQAYNGEVSVKITPGELVSPSTSVAFVNGSAQASVRARKVYGQTALWLEDIHTVNGDTLQGAQGELQLTREVGTWATGVSNLIYFEYPSLRQMQFDPWLEKNDFSSLAGFFVEINCRKDDPAGYWHDEHGQLVVTGIFSEGFFVTDLADGDQGYNHLYAYNYSYPQDLRVGDRLDRLAGTSQDFSGCTQISFPTWLRAMDYLLDPDPFRVSDLDALLPPVVITDVMCQDGGGAGAHMCGHSKKNWALEALESARVRLENLLTPDIYIDCDFNGNREIPPDWLDATDPETACLTACLERDGQTEIVVRELIGSDQALRDSIIQDPVICPWESSIEGITPNCTKIRIGPERVCSELSTFRQYGQWTAAMYSGAGPLINLLTRETLVEYDPTREPNLAMNIEYLQGNLRQVRAARPRWMVLVGDLPNDAPDSMKP